MSEKDIEDEKEETKEQKVEKEKESNTIKISTETVATYAGTVISEIDGVYGMSGTFAGITEAISGKKNPAKGVKVEFPDEKSTKLDVSIIVEYGARIPEVAYEIQTKVKKTIEDMTGLKVTSVNVNIQGVHAVNDDKKDEEKEKEEE